MKASAVIGPTPGTLIQTPGDLMAARQFLEATLSLVSNASIEAKASNALLLACVNGRSASTTHTTVRLPPTSNPANIASATLHSFPMNHQRKGRPSAGSSNLMYGMYNPSTRWPNSFHQTFVLLKFRYRANAQSGKNLE